MRRRGALVAVGVAWTAAMIVVGVWVAHAGIFRWRPETIAGLRERATLSAELRARLKPRMQRHAAAMTELTNAVMMLDHARVEHAATALLAEPQLARPLSSESAALAAELPPVFHQLEDTLQTQARALVAAVQAGDDDALVTADVELAWTCARCHAAFAGP
ncbi:MAG TPA: hypothetical protein VF334_06825 [Polyangia bacterium]